MVKIRIWGVITPFKKQLYNYINLKLYNMKNLFTYFFAVLLFGSFSGILISMGSHIMLSITFMSLFWACMFAPMLIDTNS